MLHPSCFFLLAQNLAFCNCKIMSQNIWNLTTTQNNVCLIMSNIMSFYLYTSNLIITAIFCWCYFLYVRMWCVQCVGFTLFIISHIKMKDCKLYAKTQHLVWMSASQNTHYDNFRQISQNTDATTLLPVFIFWSCIAASRIIAVLVSLSAKNNFLHKWHYTDTTCYYDIYSRRCGLLLLTQFCLC